MKQMLNVKEASVMCGVGISTIYEMVRANQIPHVRMRYRILFHRDVLASWLRGSKEVLNATKNEA